MKTIHLAILVSTALVIAVGTYAVLVYSQPQNKTAQPEKIYFHPSNYWDKLQPGYVRISDMEPNSFGFFMYPSSFKFGEQANAYQTFLLIRLPAWLGGGKDDAASFRAYSVIDPASHCMVKYWPQLERQRIEDSCSGDMYRVTDGYLYVSQGNPVLLQENIGLPRLDLYADSEGYLYVVPPTWTDDGNGVVGIGRKISSDEIQQNTLFITQQEKLQQEHKFRAPPTLVTGEYAKTVEGDWYSEKVHYQKGGDPYHDMLLSADYCNCTDYERLLKNQASQYSEMWKFDDTMILATPHSVGITGSSDYSFDFYKDEYKVNFMTGKSFDDGMKMVLDNFFNGTALSQIHQVPIDSDQGSTS